MPSHQNGAASDVSKRWTPKQSNFFHPAKSSSTPPRRASAAKSAAQTIWVSLSWCPSATVTCQLPSANGTNRPRAKCRSSATIYILRLYAFVFTRFLSVSTLLLSGCHFLLLLYSSRHCIYPPIWLHYKLALLLAWWSHSWTFMISLFCIL